MMLKGLVDQNKEKRMVKEICELILVLVAAKRGLG